MIKEELKLAENEVEKANAKLAEVRRKNLNLQMMLNAIQQVRKGEELEYNVMLLRYYLFEINLFTPEEFALYDEDEMPLVTPEYLLEFEKDQYDQQAQRLMEEMESSGRVDDPDMALEKIKKYNEAGHKRIDQAKISGLGKDVRRHKIDNVQEKITTILKSYSMAASQRNHLITELIELMEDYGFSFSEFNMKKGDLFEIGYKGP